MARIAPTHYPERFAFEAHARRLQSQAMDRLCAAVLQRMHSTGCEAMRYVRLAIAHRAPLAGGPLSS